MKEIEILVQVFDSLDIVRERLCKLKHTETKEIIDTYYQNSLIPETTVRGDVFPTNWMRIRKKGIQQFLTFKKDFFEGKTWLYSDEHETEIGDMSILDGILTNTGWTPLITISTIKHIYIHETYEIVIEEVLGLGLFLEIEWKGKEGDPHIIKQGIRDYLKELKLSTPEELNEGKPEMMLKRISNTHFMKLQSDPFAQIESGTKDIEVRLFDTKRRGIGIGDSIIFSLNDDPTKNISVIVKNLYRFDSFAQLSEYFPLQRLGKSGTIESYLQYLRTFYSEENEKKYGVIGIEFVHSILQ